MTSRQTINIRLGDKEYERILNSNGFIYPKNKLPKGYSGDITKYCQILTANQKGLFEIKSIDFNYSDTLVYIQTVPLSLEIAQ